MGRGDSLSASELLIRPRELQQSSGGGDRLGLRELIKRVSSGEEPEAIVTWLVENQPELREILNEGSPEEQLGLRARLSELEPILIRASCEREVSGSGALSELLLRCDVTPETRADKLGEATAAARLISRKLREAEDLWICDKLIPRCVYHRPNDLAVRVWSKALAEAEPADRELWLRGVREMAWSWPDERLYPETESLQGLIDKLGLRLGLKLDGPAAAEYFNYTVGNSLELQPSIRAEELRERLAGDAVKTLGRSLFKERRLMLSELIATSVGMDPPARSDTPGAAVRQRIAITLFEPGPETVEQRLARAARELGCV